MTYDRNALLELIQQGALVEVEGRTAHDEAGLGFILSAASASEPAREDSEPVMETPPVPEAPTIAESPPTTELAPAKTKGK